MNANVSTMCEEGIKPKMTKNIGVVRIMNVMETETSIIAPLIATLLTHWLIV